MASTLNTEIEELKGISIVFVISHHLFRLFGHPIPNFFQLADVGVDIFFVISGFLIGGILFNQIPNDTLKMSFFDRLRSHSKVLKKFYIRRICRILPLAILWNLIYLAIGMSSWKPFLQALTFITNIAIVTTGIKEMAFLWSLSIEAQFYLIIPFIFLLGRTKLERFRIILAVLFAFFILFKWPLMISYFSWPKISSLDVFFHTRYDGLFIGALASYFIGRRNFFEKLRLPKIIFQLILILALIALFITPAISTVHVFNLSLRLSLAPFYSVICVILASQRMQYIPNIPYFSKALEYLGSRCYGLYLSHLACLYIAKYFLADLNWSIVLVSGLGLCLLITEILYRKFENPFRKLGYSFS